MHPLFRTPIVLALAAGALAGCQPQADPPRDAEAQALLNTLLNPKGDHRKLSLALKPRHEDYVAVFDANAAPAAESTYEKIWAAGRVVIRPKPGQLACSFWSATTQELRDGAKPSQDFPEEFRAIAGRIKPQVRWYRFKFTKEGEARGLTYDGLTHVNGRWVIFPQPWKVIRPAG